MFIPDGIFLNNRIKTFNTCIGLEFDYLIHIELQPLVNKLHTQPFLDTKNLYKVIRFYLSILLSRLYIQRFN
jgi:hypothetical protein